MPMAAHIRCSWGCRTMPGAHTTLRMVSESDRWRRFRPARSCSSTSPTADGSATARSSTSRIARLGSFSVSAFSQSLMNSSTSNLGMATLLRRTMPYRNRVTPYGDIIASAARGRFMGNRGSLHRGTDIVRQWNGRRWITCVLEFRGWRAPQWQSGRWTALFFHDEAVAMAAGHRPCALCRRSDYERYRDAWECAFGSRLGADDMDAVLHRDRLDRRMKRLHPFPWPDVPDGAFVDVDGWPAL